MDLPFGRDPNLVEVGVGGLALGAHPAVLMTPALGSCVGVTLWDMSKGQGGLAHVMLPLSFDPVEPGDEGRFAASAIRRLIIELAVLGSPKRRLVAKMAGGAAMFRADSRLATIGERNAEELKRQLRLEGIPLIAEDTGGSHARTIELHLDTGVLLVRSYQFGVREL